MKKNKGITLVALILTIVLMLILSGVSVNIGTDMIKKVKIQEIYTQLEIVQSAITTIEVPEEYKEQSVFIEYMPQQLESFNITGITYNVWINWNTKQVKIVYENQEYLGIQKYVSSEENSEKNNLIFSVNVTFQVDRYIVQIYPEDELKEIKVSYKLHNEENWILVDSSKFVIVNPGNYDFRIKDNFGNEGIKENYSINKETI